MRFLLLFLLFILALPCNGYADSDAQKDAQVITNLLKYIHGMPSTDIGIIYDPSSATSQHEAEMLAQSIGAGSEYKLSVMSVDGLLHNAQTKFVIMTKGLTEHFASIARHARDQHIFTLSLDPACTQQKNCVLSVDTTSGVEIFLDEVLLRELGFDVDAALRFMVKRV